MKSGISDSTSRLAAIVRASNAAISSVDREGRIQDWNGGAAALFGFTADEVAGQDHRLLLPEDRLAEAHGQHAQVMAGATLTADTIRRHKSGRPVEVALSLAPLRDRRGAIVGVGTVAQLSERKFLERALLEAAERESRRIGQELHDHLCQHLLGAAFAAKAVGGLMPPGSPAVPEMDALARLINSAVQQVREIARGLNPVELDSAGLMAALQELAQRPRSLRCHLDCQRPVLLPDAESARHLYRIAQEAVSNAVAHSGGAHLVISLRDDAQHVTLTISDDGRGFDAASCQQKGLGLESMKYRAQAIGARISVDTREEGGTRVECVLPKPR